MEPSLGLFKRILEGIPYSVADFFTEEVDEGPQIFFSKNELTEISSGPVSCRQVGRQLRGLPLQILHETYAAGADTGRAHFKHAAWEGGIVIKGQIEVTVGDQVQTLGPGDAYFFDSQIPHRFRNAGEVECELISACSPPSF